MGEELQLHCCLSFKVHHLSQSQNRSHRVEQPASTGGQRRLDALPEQFHQQVRFLFGKLPVQSRPCVFAHRFVQHSQRRAPRLLHGAFTPRKQELAQVGKPLETRFGNQQELAAPHRAIGSVARSIPRHPQHRRGYLVLRYTRQHVRQMMLYLIHGQSHAVRRLRGDVIGMHIARYCLWLMLP